MSENDGSLTNNILLNMAMTFIKAMGTNKILKWIYKSPNYMGNDQDSMRRVQNVENAHAYFLRTIIHKYKT
jgi:hypothetical protein